MKNPASESRSGIFTVKKETMKVAIQGIRGSFHDIAAHEFFKGEDLELVCCDTFEQLFSVMKEDDACLGLMAIENTIAGSLLHNYELLRESGMTIIGEHKLHIEHSIMCLPGEDWGDIREVNSHPVALAQCRGFLARHPAMKVVEVDDTAGAAARIAQEKLSGHAAICHVGAAPFTACACWRKALRTTSITLRVFSLSVIPGMPTACANSTPPIKAASYSRCRTRGSLSQVLSILSFYKINLSKIQSLPIIGREWQYLFYVDVIYDDYMRYRQSIDAVRPLIKELKILGEYEGK